jgi:integrase
VITIHDLRHTHASPLLSAGEPVKTVSEWLGHASVTVTLTVYGRRAAGEGDVAAAEAGEADWCVVVLALLRIGTRLP